MNKLRLMQVKDSIVKRYPEYYGKYEGKVYVFLGEFEHASGHMLLREFGNGWEVSGMHEMHDWDFIDKHPGDVEIEISIGEDDFEEE